jgi:hypothetical protein
MTGDIPGLGAFFRKSRDPFPWKLFLIVFIVVVLIASYFNRNTCYRQECWPVDADQPENNSRNGGYTMQCDVPHWQDCSQ